MSMFLAYVITAGSTVAGVQIARGLVGGAHQLLAGRHQEALASVVGGLVAPLVQAGGQVWQLGRETAGVVQILAAEVGRTSQTTSAPPKPQPRPRPGPSTTAVNGKSK